MLVLLQHGVEGAKLLRRNRNIQPRQFPSDSLSAPLYCSLAVGENEGFDA
jgi:hypothetical protein